MMYIVIPTIFLLTYLNGKQRKGGLNQSILFYYLPGCPYCQKVRDELDAMKLSYKLIDVSIDKNQKQMMKKRHNRKTSVPFLIIDGKRIDESDHIIRYLRQTFQA